MDNQALAMFQQTVKQKDEYIWIKPICDFFNIDYKWQVDVIRNDHILASMVEKNSNYSLFGDNRNRVLLPEVGFIRWVQILNPKIVREDLQEKFKQYQKLIFDFLYGSVEQSRHFKAVYRRRKKMRRVYNRMGNELQALSKEIEGQLDNRCLQKRMHFIEE
jgi:hypothetical protein